MLASYVVVKIKESILLPCDLPWFKFKHKSSRVYKIWHTMQ